MNDNTRELLIRGIAAAKAKEYKEATFYLEWLLRLDPPLEQAMEAWYWLSEVSDDPKKSRNYIEEILARNPYDARARRKLAILDGKLKPEEIVDPDRLHRMAPPGGQRVEANRFTCPKCGGRMTFSPDGQSLVCEYCELQKRPTLMSEEPSHRPNSDFFLAMATSKGHSKPVTTKTLVCQGCGANFFLPPEQISLTCPYCGSAHVIRQDSSTEIILPEAIIPFQINETQSKNALRIWFQERKFEKIPRVTPGKGLYTPVWAFDLGGMISWKCQSYDRRNKRWVTDSGEEPVLTSNILVSASQRILAVLPDALQSYNPDRFIPYDPTFLANWPAESYQVSMADASLEARKITLEKYRKRISSSLTREYRDLVLNSAHMTVDLYRLVMLPVWLAQFEYNGKWYDIVINGYTAEVFTEYSPKGILGWLDKLIGGE